MNLLIVVAFFAFAWWPMQKVTGGEREHAESNAGASVRARMGGEGFTIRVMSSAALESLSISNLGVPLVTMDEPEEFDGLDFEYSLGEIESPPEGVEFWVEAVFLPGKGDVQRPAISLELAPDDMERDPKTVTLWGAPGESKIDAPAFFLWPENSN
ncbi:MAG: hypothetical protein ACSHX7_07320 [Luteolibacter sp.]